MAIQLDKEIIDLLKEEETIKVLATTDAQGVPHAVIKQSLYLGEDGNLVYLELLESSKTNKNLVRSIWFNRSVSVILANKEGESYQIIGRPIRTLIAGPAFQKHYVNIRELFGGDVDLAAVWIIEPEQVINQTFSVRKAQEDALHPTFKHLDLLARKTA